MEIMVYFSPRPVRPPRKNPDTYSTARWVDPRVGPGVLEKIKIFLPTGFAPRTAQLVAYSLDLRSSGFPDGPNNYGHFPLNNNNNNNKNNNGYSIFTLCSFTSAMGDR
jgi:hypothetical protein